jgi:fructokinase
MPEPAVVVAGDAFVDLTSTTTASGGPAYEPHPGGSCLNVAVGLARQGVPTSLLARVSTDGFGTLLREHLTASGVLDHHLITTPDLTGLAVADLTDGQAGYSFHTAGSADRGLRPEDLHAVFPAGFPPAAALHLGSVALVQEPQASTLLGLLRAESGRRLISLDPNVRPKMIPDRGRYLDSLTEWVGLSDVVKVSDEDLAWLYPTVSADSVAQRWLELGAGLVVVTAGADGASGRTARAAAQVPTPEVTVVDTVGAGDAFTAGMLAELHRAGRLTRAGLESLDSGTLASVLRAAAAVAAATCTRAGAEPPFRGAQPV